jgi:hypothetical protein
MKANAMRKEVQTVDAPAPLKTAKELIKTLNRLHDAQRKKDKKLATEIEEEIKGFVPPGVYDGYIEEETEVSSCQVLKVERRGGGANAHTFSITLRKLDFGGHTPVGLPITMDLVEFLSDIKREKRGSVSQYTGRRFWPFSPH